MKKLFYYVLIITTFLTLGMFSGCSKNTDAESKEIASRYITFFYTIDKNDLENYKIITNGFIPNDANSYNKFIKAKNSCDDKFKPLMTDSAYKDLLLTRMSYRRAKDAYENQYYCKVKNIKLEKYDEIKDRNELIYYYTIEIIQTSVVNNKKTIIRQGNQICIVKENSAWKVSLAPY
ncbi:hypothetical protein HBE96_07395 [Clostridium sp. P21]|uniref:Lipoprotein n=1 Tax=Clostridium muellerianum TaxID=2716538 RepID=A0A7Y0EFL5_9CLOT|nr:hypothetical protein [Clostridium muellerianum]NMM62518.1 hypothetical protein [Clostridium muellerianum]